MSEGLEYLRNIESPITHRTLDGLTEDATVQIGSYSHQPPVVELDLPKLASLLERHPGIKFRVFGIHWPEDLEFLRYFPRLRRFQCDIWTIGSIDGLRYLPEDAGSIGLGQTKKRFSLSILDRFGQLRELYLEGHTKDIQVISRLRKLETLTLRSITLPDLSILTPLEKLWWLAIKLGGTKDLSLLPEVGRLKYLELWLVRGLSDMQPISGVESLQYLFLQALKQVDVLPDFARLRDLRRVHLETMKGLTDLSPLVTATSIEDLEIIDCPSLKPEDMIPLKNHPSLKRAWIGLGSLRKNQAAQDVLGLPPVPMSKSRFEYR